jgi:hypothetical protein
MTTNTNFREFLHREYNAVYKKAPKKEIIAAAYLAANNWLNPSTSLSDAPVVSPSLSDAPVKTEKKEKKEKKEKEKVEKTHLSVFSEFFGNTENASLLFSFITTSLFGVFYTKLAPTVTVFKNGLQTVCGELPANSFAPLIECIEYFQKYFLFLDFSNLPLPLPASLHGNIFTTDNKKWYMPVIDSSTNIVWLEKITVNSDGVPKRTLKFTLNYFDFRYIHKVDTLKDVPTYSSIQLAQKYEQVPIILSVLNAPTLEQVKAYNTSLPAFTKYLLNIRAIYLRDMLESPLYSETAFDRESVKAELAELNTLLAPVSTEQDAPKIANREDLV